MSSGAAGGDSWAVAGNVHAGGTEFQRSADPRTPQRRPPVVWSSVWVGQMIRTVIFTL